MPNLDQARRFLAALGGWSGPAHTFQTYGDAEKDPSLVRILNGTLTDHAAELERLNAEGAGVFVTVNRTDLAGRTSSNILAPRAVFIDFDGPSGRGVGARPPSMIVRSVRGPHLYWLLHPEQDLSVWSKVQKSIARRYGGDVACHDLPRVMRLPGFEHRKGSPKPVDLDTFEPDRRYTLGEIVHAYALDLEEPKPKAPPARLDTHRLSDRQRRCRAFLDACPAAVEGQGGWAQTSGICGIGGDFGLEPDEFMPVLMEWNGRCDPPWDEADLHRKLLAIHLRRDKPFGWRLEEERDPPSPTRSAPRRPEPPPLEPPPDWRERGGAAAPDAWEGVPFPEEPPAGLDADRRFSVGAQGETSPEEETSPPDDAPHPADPEGSSEPERRKVSELRSVEQLQADADALLKTVAGGDGTDPDPDAVFAKKNLLLLVEIQRRRRRLFQQVWRALGNAKPKVPLQDLRQAMGHAAPPRRPSGGEGGAGKEPSRIVLDPDYPHDSAILFMRDRATVLRSHLRVFYEYQGHRYVEQPAESVDKAVREFGKRAHQWDTKATDYVRFKTDTRKTTEVVAAMHSERLVGRDQDVPAWLCECKHPCRCHDDKPPGDEITPCRNGLLHLRSKRLIPSSPDFFATHCVDADYDRASPCLIWVEFLHDLFGADKESADLLQEFMGYLLTQDTSLQKALLMIGPPRAGKGTITSVMKALVGDGNFCAPSLGDFATQFGMQPFIGKSLAVVPDASLDGRSDGAQVAERLRAIIGEDTVQIDRKGIAPVQAQLKARIVLSTNETPKWKDATGALQNRFMVLRLTKTWLHREDPTLRDRILAELSGILNWAIDGWERLYQRGHFVQPSRSKPVVHEMIGLGAPVAAFVEERCVVGEGSERLDALFSAWKDWCEENGYDRPGSKPQFGKNLSQIVPTLEKARVSDPSTNKRRFVYSGIRLRLDLE